MHAVGPLVDGTADPEAVVRMNWMAARDRNGATIVATSLLRRSLVRPGARSKCNSASLRMTVPGGVTAWAWTVDVRSPAKSRQRAEIATRRNAEEAAGILQSPPPRLSGVTISGSCHRRSARRNVNTFRQAPGSRRAAARGLMNLSGSPFPLVDGHAEADHRRLRRAAVRDRDARGRIDRERLARTAAAVSVGVSPQLSLAEGRRTARYHDLHVRSTGVVTAGREREVRVERILDLHAGRRHCTAVGDRDDVLHHRARHGQPVGTGTVMEYV